jgi:hypothetical protein
MPVDAPPASASRCRRGAVATRRLHIVLPAWHVRGLRIGERFKGAVRDGGHDVFNTVTHRGRQGVVRQHALGNVRQAVRNRVFGKGARVGAS